MVYGQDSRDKEKMLVSLSLSLFFNLPFFIPLSDLSDPRISRERKRVRERERDVLRISSVVFGQTRAIKRVTLVSFDPAHAGKINFIRSEFDAGLGHDPLTPSCSPKTRIPPSFIDSFNEFLAGNKRCRRKSPYDFGGEIMVRAGERFIKRRQRSDIGWEGG